MISCVYTITNIKNNKVYVGKTHHFYSRKSQHRRALFENKHFNKHLQRAWNIYGESSFVFEILEEYPIEYLYAMEHYWCNMLDSFNYEKGYNERPTHPLNKGSNSIKMREQLRQINLGKKASPEAKLKMSLAKLGKVTSTETKLKMSIARKGKSCSEETKQKMSINRYNNPLKSFLGKKHSEELAKQIAEHRKVSIIQYSLNMQIIKEWKSSKDACDILGISRANISSCCTLKRKEAGGFIWRHKTKIKYV